MGVNSFNTVLQEERRRLEGWLQLLKIDLADLYEYIGLMGQEELYGEKMEGLMRRVASGDITVKEAVQELKS